MSLALCTFTYLYIHLALFLTFSYQISTQPKFVVKTTTEKLVQTQRNSYKKKIVRMNDNDPTLTVLQYFCSERFKRIKMNITIAFSLDMVLLTEYNVPMNTIATHNLYLCFKSIF